ncbi:MAG TPA: diaminopimelate dehydrogenase [Oscillospiraceae bacterium]|nr:diaminopimelate dehydrogenase [Oscillospiraceae bacterium]
MTQTIKVGIVGYGNLGRGVEAAIAQNPDLELAAIFTRRSPQSLQINNQQAAVLHIDAAEQYQDKIDVMILCGGSATDLPAQSPIFAAHFNIVNSFDTHAKIPEHFQAVDAVAKANGTTAAISIGWDPGLFSLNRLLAGAVLPEGRDYTFWGRGVSQGHSEAIRRIEGVKYAVQYTIPIPEAMERVRKGENPELTAREKHLRACYVVAAAGADTAQITQIIKTIPNYFAEYDTEVNFISEEEFKQQHSKMPHGGFVIRSGRTGLQKENQQMLEFSLKLESNPEFTSSVLVAFARAVYRLNREGQTGAKTIFDIPLGYLSHRPAADLRRELL